MTDKQIEKEIKQVVTNLGNIEFTVEDELNFCKEVLKRKEQEYEELRKYHNKCCEENAKKLEEWLEQYNQVSKDFYNGKYCNKENCNLLKAKEQECEELKETLKTKAKGWANVNDKILEEVKQIRVENEKLKTALKFRDSSIDAKNKEILKKCKNNRELIDKNWKLIKTLTEIKEVAEICTSADSSELLLKRIKHILREISEVVDETIR